MHGRRRTSLTLLVAFGAAGLVRPGAVPAQDGAPAGGGGGASQHVGRPDMYLDFQVSGAELEAERDAGGNPTGRYTGRITGDKLSVSGSAHFEMGKGLVTYLSLTVGVSAGDARGEHHWPPEGGARTVTGGESGVTIDDTFHVEVDVPKVAPTASIGLRWTNCGDWVCGGVEASITLSGPKPLCPEAASLFNLVAGQGSSLQFDLPGLIGDLQRAMAAHPGGVTISDSPVPPLDTAWKWLMPNGFQEDEESIRRWSFTDFRQVDVSGIAAHQTQPDGAGAEDSNGWGLYSGTYTPPAGAGEALLAKAAADAAQQRGQRLSPGELLGLALRQTGGDARRAALLAHNMLKALGRGGGERVTGLRMDQAFFRNYLAPLRDDRTGSADDTSRNAGEWYHLFGTMAFRLETIQGVNGFSDKIIRTGSTLGTYLAALAAAASLKITAPLYSVGILVSHAGPRSRRIRELLTNLVRQGLTPGKLGYSEWANWAEQVFREQIDENPKPPDPEKYCINVWGEELADAVYRHVYPDPDGGGLFDDIRVNPWSNVAGDSIGLNGPPVEWDPTQPVPRMNLDPPDTPSGASSEPSLEAAPGTPPGPALRLLGVHSPVDVVLEVDGRAVVLAQSAGMLLGDAGVPVLALPESDGTYMFAAVVRADQAVKMSLFGAGDGTAHVGHLDTAGGRFTTWDEPVQQDTVLTLDLPSAETDVDKALQRADGTTVAPVQAALDRAPATAARVAWTLGLLGSAVLVLVVLALVRRRRLRPGAVAR